jgi:pimeloyl-ACP methyl ester carboxylesterase
MPGISRRSLLVGGLGLAGAAIVGKVALDRADGLPHGVPDVAAGRMVSGDFVSAKRNGVRTGWTIAYPPGHADDQLPVLIALHGRTGDHRDAFGGSLRLERFLADGVHHGMAPFAIASVDGGDHTYWHPRRDGDASAMVLEEFIPLLTQHGLKTARVAFLGWSMGGYGALYLAGRLGASRVSAVVAESPAIYHEAGQSASGAFDDADDFDAHAIFGRLDKLAGIPARIDCGDRDGFAPVTRDLRAALSPTPAGGIEPGAHDDSYWRSQARAQLAFVAAHAP